jgi:PAS domain S-box-containing protein
MASGREGTIRVLCVDDDTAFLNLVGEMLGQEPDIETVTASSGTAGLDVLAAQDVDCVVSDFDMPGMSGLELLSAVRDDHPEMPFILFTGKGSEEIASEAISAGVTDYLQKEVGTEQYDLLANRIRSAVQYTREATQRARAEEWYRQVFEQRLIGVGLSQDGVFKQANQKLADMFGYDRTELIGMPALDTIAPEDHDRVEQMLERRADGEVDTLRYTVTGLRADGERLAVEVNGGRVDYFGEPAVLGLVQPLREQTVTDDDPILVDLARADRHLSSLAADVDDDRLAAARRALAEATGTFPRSDQTGDERTDGSVTATLREAARTAWKRLDTGPDATLDVTDDAELTADDAFLVDFFENVFTSTVGCDPAECEVTIAETPDGFRVRVSSPKLADMLFGDLYGAPNPRPDPVSGLASQRGWDVLINTIDGSTVEYELRRVSFAEER